MSASRDESQDDVIDWSAAPADDVAESMYRSQKKNRDQHKAAAMTKTKKVDDIGAKAGASPPTSEESGDVERQAIREKRQRVSGAAGGIAPGDGAHAESMPRPSEASAGAAGGRPVTRSDLSELWQSLGAGHHEVLPFYGHSKDKPMASFSNFYIHEEFEFCLPDAVWREGCGFPRSVGVMFTEKAIMLCKACVFNDRASFDAICKAAQPATAKK